MQRIKKITCNTQSGYCIMTTKLAGIAGRFEGNIFFNLYDNNVVEVMGAVDPRQVVGEDLWWTLTTAEESEYLREADIQMDLLRVKVAQELRNLDISFFFTKHIQ